MSLQKDLFSLVHFAANGEKQPNKSAFFSTVQLSALFQSTTKCQQYHLIVNIPWTSKIASRLKHFTGLLLISIVDLMHCRMRKRLYQPFNSLH